MSQIQASPEQIRAFIEELNGFATTAETTLKKIEENKGANKSLFSVFSERMLTIRGTADQLGLEDISHISRLGEEIAVKGSTAETNRQIRKCIGSLWDALTTVKYMLEHYDEETDDTQRILINRLENTLNAFGGARPSFSETDIESLMKSRQS